MAWLLVLAATAVALSAAAAADAAEFGRPMLSEFQLAPDYMNFNYGSFGSVPSQVMSQLRAYEDEMEARPDIWMRAGYRELLVAVRQRLAAYVGASDPNDIVLVENTSSGNNLCNSNVNIERLARRECCTTIDPVERR